jgi:hypothetical protein
MRILRMTYLARAQPDNPADYEFDQNEIIAVITLARPPNHRRGAMPTMQQMVSWIAQLGGYVGRSSGGPPGPAVLSRGLLFIRSAVALLAAEKR